MLLNKTSPFDNKADVQDHDQPHNINGVAMICGHHSEKVVIIPRSFDIILGRVSFLNRRQLPLEHIECRHNRCLVFSCTIFLTLLDASEGLFLTAFLSD